MVTDNTKPEFLSKN